jgi:AcrR family transcriptional regulator
MSSVLSLNDRHTDATQKLILSTALDLLERSGVTEVTVRAVAKQSGMSERTIFRYFADRDEFLDALAKYASDQMHTPAPPVTIDELLKYPAPLYRAFEARAQLIQGVLHTEIFTRVRYEVAEQRWRVVADLIEGHASHRPKKERVLAATNINYYLSATTWNYFRKHFRLSLDDTIACAKSAVRLNVEEIGKKRKK